ncbi:hypothetical protein QOZ80_7BG0584560 [Eleusine coracana subsp. coracana]|nr:hypothetical protein QOZ80_7BG0584560 [Eleusine coracana subsp. coracana]
MSFHLTASLVHCPLHLLCCTQMEALLSAILGELTARSIKLLISKISKPNVSDMEDRLHHVLLRAQVIVDEAMGRHITNQAMLCQLDMLRDVMHRGSYTLDTFRYISHEEGPNDMAVSRCPSLGRVNSLKSFCFSSRDTPILEKLQEVLDDLSSMILDMQEFVVFLMSYPCRYHQPYSMHLLLHNCMFGYQMEAELVINFLLHRQSHGTQELEVLPIFGPGKVGKSTLVAHVCKDERVRAHFTEILFLRDCEFSGDELATFRQGCAMRHQNRASNWNKDERLVVVVELHGDLNEDEWSKFYTTSKRYLPSGSKIIVTSRSEMIVKFGTTQALNLKHLSREAYWYFFKTLTFGSTDPGMHPRLASLAMEIAKLLDGTLFRASITACVLRENFDINFWCRVRAFLRGLIQKRVSRYGEHPFNLTDQNRPARFRSGTASEDFVIYHRYYQRPPEEEVPKIKIQDVIYGNVKPHGKFEALAWRSPIPPYHSYVYTCEIVELKSTAVKRKRSRSMRDEATLYYKKFDLRLM